jgi:hypothetical protein
VTLFPNRVYGPAIKRFCIHVGLKAPQIGRDGKLTPFLVDLPGRAANKADGMAMPEPGGNKLTKATRTYKRGGGRCRARRDTSAPRR